MKVFLVQGEHFSVPGRPQTVYATAEQAEARAIELVNIMRSDMNLPPITANWETGLEEVRAALRKEDNDEGAEECDVWITPLDLDLPREEPRTEPVRYRWSAANQRRRHWATAAIEAFTSKTRQRMKEDGPEEIISDMLCNLRHWCRQQRKRLDFDELVARANRLYWDEARDGE